MNEMANQTQTIGRRRVPIDDGRWVSIRPIERFDASRLSDFYAALSPESRRRRFLGSAPALDPDLVEGFTEAGEGIVGILVEQGPNDGAVVAHASVQAAGLGAAEIAFAVADGLQGYGLGRVLVREAIELALARGMRSVTATLLAENTPMRRLLLDAGCPIADDAIDAGVEEITLQIGSAA